MTVQGRIHSNNQIINAQMGTVVRLGEEERQALLKEIADLKNEVIEKEAEKAVLVSQLENANIEIAELQGQVDRLVFEIGELNAEIETLTSTVEDLRSEKTTLENQLQDAESQISTLETEISSLNAEIERLEAEVDTAFAEGQESMIDRSKVIEKTVTANSIVSLNDVSEIPHSVGVKVESRNLISLQPYAFGNVYNRAVGHVFDKNDSGTVSYSVTNSLLSFKANTEYDGCLLISKKIPIGVYRVSFSKQISTPSGNSRSCVYILNESMAVIRKPFFSTVDAENKSWTVNLKDDECYIAFGIVSTVADGSIELHELQVEKGNQATPYTDYVEDISTVEVRQYGKNWFDGVLEFGIIAGSTGADAGNSSSYIRGKSYIPVVEGLNYSFSVEGVESGNMLIYEYKEDFIYNMTTNTAVAMYKQFYTPSENTKYIRIRPGWSITTLDVNIQMEIGTQSTPYEPYQEHTFTPNADGTVDGVQSISPTMNIMTDKAVDIAVDYWKSYGMQLEHERTWKSGMQNGTKTAWSYLFAGSFWDDVTFKPTDDIIVTGGRAEGMFRQSRMTNLKKIIEECDVEFDLSRATSVSFLCYYSTITHLPKLDFSNASIANQSFIGCTVLISIDEIVSNANLEYPNTFQNCPNLQHVKFSGVIGQNIDFSYSPLLTVESLLSILTALSKDSTLASGKTVTLATEHQEKIESDSACAEQLALAVSAGWTVSYITR